MLPMTLLWIVLMIVFIVVELNTMGLTTVWFALGAMAAAFVSLSLTDNFLAQIATFVIVTGVAVMLSRPFARKFASKSVPTNANRVIGEQAVVVEKINDGSVVGQVKVLGQIWTAKAKEADAVFDVGDTVIVEEIQGVKLIVKSLNK